MKKALAMALGAMLVAGSAVPAAAKSQVDFSGHYRTFMVGQWNQNFLGGKFPADPLQREYSSDDFFFADRLQMDFGFHATDEISVYWRLRAPSKKRWGTVNGNGNEGKSRDSSIESRYYYGEVKQDWGTISIGRLKDSYADFGLASLGYAPDGPDQVTTYMGVFDFDKAVSGIRYANRWDNGFQLAALFYRLDAQQKVDQTAIATLETGDPLTLDAVHDETADLFAVEPAFFWDGGGASLGIHYLRDHTKNGGYDPAYKEYALNPAFYHTFGDFSVHFEGKAGWGKASGVYEDIYEDIKANGYAAYLDFDYNYGPGNVTLAGWWAAGPGDPGTNDNKYKGTVGMGSAFAPLVVAYGANGTGWNYQPVTAIQMANALSAPVNPDVDEQFDANHMAIDLTGAHAFTDDLTLTYALAYLTLNKVRPGAKKNIGWEADLGLQIQLLDNLSLGTTFGYLFAGDALALKDLDGTTIKEKKDAYTWFSTLTFSF